MAHERVSRNYGLLLFEFLLPAIQVRFVSPRAATTLSPLSSWLQIIIFCLAIGGDPTGLKIAVVNQDVGASPPPDWTHLANADWCDKGPDNQTQCFLSRAYLDQLDTKTVTVRNVRAIVSIRPDPC